MTDSFTDHVSDTFGFKEKFRLSYSTLFDTFNVLFIMFNIILGFCYLLGINKYLVFIGDSYEDNGEK